MTEQIKTDKVGFGELHNSDDKGFSDQDIISQFTRADAIAEGVLMDLSAGFSGAKRLYKYNVCCTQAVWQIINSTPSEWVICEVLQVLIASQNNKTKIIDEGSHLFEVIIENSAPSDRHTMKIVFHPGDDMEPVLTISLPNED